jgi:hypothetical protein
MKFDRGKVGVFIENKSRKWINMLSGSYSISDEKEKTMPSIINTMGRGRFSYLRA